MATVNPLGPLAGPAQRGLGAPVRVGTVGGAARAAVDGAGSVVPDGARWRIEWWVGADDRWRLAGEEAAVRQRRLGGAPVVETAMRVPGGDALARTFGIGGDPDGIVIEVENASAAPFALALVLRPVGARRSSGLGIPGAGSAPPRVRGGLSSVTAHGSVVDVDGSHRLLVPRPPMRWAVGRAGTGECRDVVVGGEAFADAFGGPDGRADDPDGALEAALLFPVAHRATFRTLLTPVDGRGAAGGPPPAAGADGHAAAPGRWLGALPGAADAARGWSSLLDRGMRATLPDGRTSELLTAARAAVLLDPSADVATMAVLEDWGLDAEAEEVWSRLGLRARRAARRRPPFPAVPEAALAEAVAGASPIGTWREGPVPFLRALHVVLVDDGRGTARRDGAVGLLPALPSGWVGRDLEVHDAPVRAGRVSYALRWHGGHPLLMWELAGASERKRGPAVTLRAPSLDPGWSTPEHTGDTLLGHHHDHPGAAGADPGPEG